MRTSPLSLVATSFIAAAAGLVALSQWSRARHALAERQLQQTTYAQLTPEVHPLAHDSAKPAPRGDDAAASPTPTPQSSVSPAPAPSPSPPLEPGIGGELAELIAEHPEWRETYAAAERANFLLNYGPFLHAPGMTAAQRERFLAELSLREQKRAALRLTASRNNWKSDAPELAELQQAENTRLAGAFTSALGPADYARLQEFERTSGVRAHVTELATQLYTTPTPLDAATAEHLVQALAPHANNAAGKITFNSIRWDEALPVAKTVLAPEQYALFVRLREAAQQQQQLNRLVAKSQTTKPSP